MLIEAIGEEGSNPDEILREDRFKSTLAKARTSKDRQELDEPVLSDEDYRILLATYEGFAKPPRWAIDEKKLTPEVCKRYGIRWDRGWIIPIAAPRDRRLLGWQFKRAHVVLNYPNRVKKSETLFGYRQARRHASRTVVLVESPLDAVYLSRIGVSAVASYGAFVSKVQISLLIGVADRIVLALDNDDAGRIQTEKLYKRVAPFLPTRVLEYPDRVKDPGDMGLRELAEVFT